MNQIYEQKIKEYKQKLKKLEKNSRLSEEQLQTIYKTAYLKLRQEIKEQTAYIIKIFAFGYCKQEERLMIQEFLDHDPIADYILKERLRGLLRMPDFSILVDTSLELKMRYEMFKKSEIERGDIYESGAEKKSRKSQTH